MPIRSRLLVPALAAALLLSSCTGTQDEEGEAAHARIELPEEIEPVASFVLDREPERLRTPGPLVWHVDGRVVLPEPNRITAYEVDGTEIWRWRKREICAVSDTVNTHGHVAVAHDEGPRDCGAVTLLDTHTGKALWSTTASDSSWLTISLSDTTVHLSHRCGGVLRFDVETGRQVRSIGRDQGCGHPFLDAWANRHDSKWVVIAPVGGGTEVWDATTRLRVWSAPGRRDSFVEGIVLDDPLVVDAADKGAHSHLWRMEQGRFEARFGPSHTGEPPRVLGLVDGLLVAHFEDGLTRAIDLDTGEEVLHTWARDSGSGDEALATEAVNGLTRLIGHDGSRLLILREDYHPEHGRLTWLEARSVRDPSDVTTLGTISVEAEAEYNFVNPDAASQYPVAEVIDGTLRLFPFTDSMANTSSYLVLDLPDGTPGAFEGFPDEQETVGGPGPELAHDPGDASISCSAITPETLTRIGMEDLRDVNPPVDCRWMVARGEPGGWLNITAKAFDGESQDAANRNASKAMSNVDGRRAHIADEAVVRYDHPYSRDDHMTATASSSFELFARQDNLVITVTHGQWVEPKEAERFGVSPATAEDGVLAALGDVLADLGVDRPAEPEPSDPGRFTSTDGLCETIANEVAADVGDAPLAVHRRDSRRVWCDWGDLVVTAEAARGSILTGDDAADVAAQTLGWEPGRRISGIGAGGKAADRRLRAGDRRVLTAQFDNLVVGVSQAMPAGADRPSLDARARTLALAARDALR